MMALFLPVLLGLALIGSSTKRAQAVDWAIGDVFAGVASGCYNVYDNSGVFKEQICDGQGGFTTGCAFNLDQGKLYTTNFSAANLKVYDDPHPHTISQTINGAAQGGAGTESVVFAANGDFYVGHASGNGDIQKFDGAGIFLQQFNVATENVGSDWIDLAADQCTMFYTSEGRTVFNYDVCTDTQLANFAVLPGGGNSFALRLLPPGDGSGGLLVADRSNIKRLDGSGNVIQTYDVVGEDSWFALNLDPNGTSFWSGDFGTDNFYRFNIATGAIEIGPISTGSGGNLFGLCLKGEPTAGGGDRKPNHYLGYNVRQLEGDGSVPVVKLTDQFGEGVFKVVKKSAVHYNPVDKNEEGIPSPEVHQVGYALMRTEGTDSPHTVDVTNQFGTITVTTGAANRLLVPSTKQLGVGDLLARTLINGPLPEEVENHFLCYGLESYGEFEPREVTVADQFKGTRPFSVLRPIALCNPVTKEHQYPDGGFGKPEPPVKPENHLLCYGGGVKTRERFGTIQFETHNQFGKDFWEARRDGGVLCVPSEKEEKEETGACCLLRDKNSTLIAIECLDLQDEECVKEGGVPQAADSCEDIGGAEGCVLPD